MFRLLKNTKNYRMTTVCLLGLLLVFLMSEAAATQIYTQYYTQPLELSPEESAFIHAHPVLRVHNELDWPPFNFNENGESSGYSIDYMKLLADKIGVRVEFISGPSWDEFLTMIRNKELDVMLNIINTEDRRKYLLFTEKYYEPFNTIFTREGAPEYETLGQLAGKKIAVPQGFYTQELLQRYYPEIELYLTQDMLGSLKAVKEGQAFAAIGVFGVVNYIIQKHDLKGIKPLTTIKDEHFRNVLSLGVRKDWPLLQSILNKAIASISDQEILRLRDRWFGNRTKSMQLNEEEQSFLQAHRVLRVHNELNFPPFNYNDDGVPKGFSIDFMNLVAQHLRLNIEYVSGPSWNEFLTLIGNKQIDVMLNIKATPGWAKFIEFTAPYYKSVSGIYAKLGRQYGSLEELKGKKVAVTEGYYYQEMLESLYPGIELYLTRDISESVEALVFDRVDAFVADLNVANYVLKQKTITTIIPTVEINDARLTADLALGVRSDWPVLTNILQKAINSIQEEELAFVASKWLKHRRVDVDGLVSLSQWEDKYLANKPTIKLCANKAWNPIDFIDQNSQTPSGIASDSLQLVLNRLGYSGEIEFVPTANWNESLNYLKNQKCELLPAAIITRARQKYAAFTQPYGKYKVVIITRDDAPFINSMAEISDQPIAREKGSGLIQLLRDHYEGLNIVETEDTASAFKKVSDGEVFATVAILPVASHFITRLGLSNLKIAGYSEIDIEIAMAVARPQERLASILNKGLAALSDDDHKTVFSKWVSIQIEPLTDYVLVYQILAAITLLGLFFLYRHLQLTRYNRLLMTLSVTDKLTQIYNRVKLDADLEEFQNLYYRYKNSFAIILIDIDDFKLVNDSYGHQTGDRLLIELAEVLKSAARESDVLGRWGGEEFMVICPQTNLAGAKIVAEKLREALATHKFSTVGHKTASFGIAAFTDDDSISNLIKRADEALYIAKTSGKDKVS
jgi:diguanylate cyclase (GGDEF)-like protein